MSDGGLFLSLRTLLPQRKTGEKDRGVSRTRCYFTLFVCFLECLTFGGILFGWASLAYVFKQDGIYRHLCNVSRPFRGENISDFEVSVISTYNTTDIASMNGDAHSLVDENVTNHSQMLFISCPEQDSMLALAYIIGLAMFGMLSFPLGWLFDRFGLRFIRTFGSILAISSYLLMGFAEKEALSWLIFPGSVLMAMSCNIFIMTNCHVCQLAGNKTATCLTMYNGALNLSVLVFLILKLAHDAGVPRRHSFAVLIGAHLAVVLSTFLLLPPYKVSAPSSSSPPPDPPEESLHPESAQLDPPPRRTRTFRRHCFSLVFVGCIIWFALLHVRINMFIGTFSGWILDAVGGDEEKASYFTNIFGSVQLSGIIISPISGILIDWRRAKLKMDGIEMKTCGTYAAFAAVPSLAIGSLAGVLFSAFVLIPGEAIIYAALAASEATRSFTYATAIAFIELTFPAEHFGKLFGWAYCTCGVSTFMQYPYAIWAEHSGYFRVNIWLLGTTAVSAIFPLMLAVRHTCRPLQV